MEADNMFMVMFYVGLTLAIIFLVVSIVLFVKNDMAKVVGDVTGWNKKRAKKKIHRISANQKSVHVNANIQEVMVTTLLEKRSALLEDEKSLLKDDQTKLLTEKLLGEKEVHKKVLKNVVASDDFFEVEESVTITHTEECIDV